MKRTALVFLLLLSSLSIFVWQHMVLQLHTLAQSDTTPPLTTATLSGTQGQNDWYISGVDAHLVADDLESGVHSLNWKLNDGDRQQEIFLETLNRVQNPSFENGTLSEIDSWNYFSTTGGAAFSRFEGGKFGSYSARIMISAPGYHYWHNRDYYLVTEANEVYTVSAWLKTEGLTGDGGYVAVWGRNLSGPDALLAQTAKISGTNDWTRVSLSFLMPEGYDGAFLQLVAEGASGSVWWDGVSFYEDEESGLNFVVGQSGQHSLEYYAVDNAGNEELPHKSMSFKIDTSAPTNWKNFEAVRTLNDHTFICKIDVSDTISGLDVSTAAYQYTWDGGLTWSAWLTNVTVNPNVDGSTTVRITTPDVDFHDSNWEVDKVIRFRISNLAGLEGTSPDQHLFGAWMKTTGGDIYTGGIIEMTTFGSGPNAEGVITATGPEVENFYSAKDWTVISYSQISRPNFSTWLQKFPTTSPLPYGRLPLTSGRYFASGRDFVIDKWTIPGELSSVENLAAVVFVGGDLIVNANLTLRPTSVLLFIVGGEVKIAKGVEKVAASFLADGNFDTSYDGSPPQKQLVVNGLVGARGLALRRGLSGNDNLTKPGEVFNYPGNIINLAPYLGEGAVRWREK